MRSAASRKREKRIRVGETLISVPVDIHEQLLAFQSKGRYSRAQDALWRATELGLIVGLNLLEKQDQVAGTNGNEMEQAGTEAG